jgi:ankyrin repeat protein
MTRKKRISEIEIMYKTHDWLECISQRDLEQTQLLYKQYPYIDINSISMNGNALHIALTTYDESEAMIDYLIGIGVDIEAKKPNNGWTPLFTACNYALSHDKNLNALLKYKPNIHVIASKYHSGGNILHLLTSDKRLDRLKNFIDMGVDPYVLDKNGANILHIATSQNWNPIVQYLLEPQFNFDLHLVAKNHRNESYTAFDATNNEIKTMLFKRDEINKVIKEKELLDNHVLDNNAKHNKVKM